MGQTHDLETTSDLQSLNATGGITVDSSTTTNETQGQLPHEEGSSDAEVLHESQNIKGAAVIKNPVFVGTAEIEVLTAIAKLLFEDKVIKDHDTGLEFPLLDKDEYQLVSLVPEVFKKLNEQYLFELLSEDEKNRQRTVNLSAEAYTQAATQAVNLDEYIKKAPKKMKLLNDDNSFTPGQLKRLYHHFRVPMSDSTTRTLIDFMTIKGFMTTVDITSSNEPFEKTKFKLILSDQQRLKNVEKKIKSATHVQNQWRREVDALKEQAEAIELRIKKEQDGATTQPGTLSQDQGELTGDSTAQ